MHIEKPKYIERLCIDSFSAVGDGMHVEIALTDELNERSSDSPIVTFREDEERGMQVVIHRDEYDVIFPLEEMKRAIEIAEQEVHCESHYDNLT